MRQVSPLSKRGGGPWGKAGRAHGQGFKLDSKGEGSNTSHFKERLYIKEKQNNNNNTKRCLFSPFSVFDIMFGSAV